MGRNSKSGMQSIPFPAPWLIYTQSPRLPAHRSRYKDNLLCKITFLNQKQLIVKVIQYKEVSHVYSLWENLKLVCLLCFLCFCLLSSYQKMKNAATLRFLPVQQTNETRSGVLCEYLWDGNLSMFVNIHAHFLYVKSIELFVFW